MKKRHIILTLIGTLVFTSSVYAQSNEITSKINPGNIFYFIDRGLENIKLKLIKDEEKRLEYLSSLALERWAEVEAAKSTNKLELINIAQDGYETAITEILNIVENTDKAHMYEVLNITEDILVQDLEKSTQRQIPKEEVVNIKEDEQVTTAENITVENIEIAKILFGQEISEELLNKISELNLMEISTIKSFADQSGKSVEEVYNVFIENENGIGITANKLGIEIKEGMKNLKKDYKKTKKIEKEYKKAQKENNKNKNKEKKNKNKNKGKKEKKNKNKDKD